MLQRLPVFDGGQARLQLYAPMGSCLMDRSLPEWAAASTGLATTPPLARCASTASESFSPGRPRFVRPGRYHHDSLLSPAELRPIETLSPFRVAERHCLAGQPIAPALLAPSGSGIIESGLKSDRRWAQTSGRRRCTTRNRAARQPRSRCRPSQDNRWGRRRHSPPAGAPGGIHQRQLEECAHASASSSARSSTDFFAQGRHHWRGGASPTTRRMAAAMKSARHVFQDRLGQRWKQHEARSRSKSAAAQAARSASGSLTSATATTGVSGSRRRTAAISSKTALTSPLQARIARRARLVAAPRVTARRQPIALTGRANGSRRPVRHSCFAIQPSASRMTTRGACMVTLPSSEVSAVGAVPGFPVPPDAATTVRGRCRAGRPPRSGDCWGAEEPVGSTVFRRLPEARRGQAVWKPLAAFRFQPAIRGR